MPDHSVLRFENPSYRDLLQPCFIENKPFIATGLCSHWSASNGWVTSSGEFNYQHFIDNHGSLQVQVADCNSSDHLRETHQLKDVLLKWQSCATTREYIKDFHLALTDPSFYTPPGVFQDDWMDNYYRAHTDDDFRFVYIGQEGTWTGLHRDVYTSYSWSTNILGKKRWTLFPPEEAHLLRQYPSSRTSEVVPNVHDVNQLVFTSYQHTNPIVIEQNVGETIFVPSGWYHQVDNLTFCVSINHNWLNSTNLVSVYNSMCNEIEDVENALSDVKELLQRKDNWRLEWYQIVQDVLRKNSGWDITTFWKMVRYALLSPPCDSALRPAGAFVNQQVQVITQAFKQRSEYTIDDALYEIVNDIIDKLA